MSSNQNRNRNARTRILEFLKTGRDITTRQAQNRFGIQNVSARVSELRQSGFAVYCNTKVTKAGNTIRTYRLGRPTREVIAAGNLVFSDPSLADLALEAKYMVGAYGI